MEHSAISVFGKGLIPSLLFDPAPLLAIAWQESRKEIVLQIGWHTSSLMISHSFPVTVVVMRPLP